MSTKSKSSKTPKSSPKASAGKKRKVIAATPVVDTAAAEVMVPVQAEGTPVETAAPAEGAKKTKKAAKAPKAPKVKKTSGLDAAAQVLADKGEPMNCKDIVDTMLAQGLWQTNGKTPHATIYSAMLREIDNKPGESRFAKTGRGLFALATPATTKKA